jgi:hypothetical protein
MTKYISKYAFVALFLVLCASAPSYGLMFRHVVPEIDPSVAISGLTLLAGALAVLRVRRHK